MPAAIAGLNVAELAELSRTMIRSCGPDVPPADNPGVALGIVLGAAAARGRDKVTMLTSPTLKSFGAWAEQLFAESTGKQGKGLIPINGEPLGRAEVYTDDQLFIDLALKGETILITRTSSRGWKLPVTRSFASYRIRQRISSKSSFVSKLLPRPPAPCLASIRSISPM